MWQIIRAHYVIPPGLARRAAPTRIVGGVSHRRTEGGHPNSD